MGEMVERVAEAIWEARVADSSPISGCPSPTAWASLPSIIKDVLTSQARAAIAAMREPTEAMVQIGYAASNAHDHMPDDIRSAWSAMIDAALADGPVTEPTSQHSQGSSEHDHS